MSFSLVYHLIVCLRLLRGNQQLIITHLLARLLGFDSSGSSGFAAAALAFALAFALARATASPFGRRRGGLFSFSTCSPFGMIDLPRVPNLAVE